MHVAFGRVRRRIARLRTSFSLMRNVYSGMVLVATWVIIGSRAIDCLLQGTMN